MQKQIWNKLGAIRVRLTLWYIFFLAITFLGFSIYLHHELQDNLSLQIDTGLQVAASHLLVDVDDSIDPPTLRPMTESVENYLVQSSFSLRLVDDEGTVLANVGNFPDLKFNPTDTARFTTITIDGVPWRIYTEAVETQAVQSTTWVQMGQSLNIIEDTQTSLRNVIIFGLPIMLIAAALGGSFMANQALHPVNTITRTVQTISTTEMTGRIPHRRPQDELSRLTETLNSMLDRLQAGFDAERRFTADASHELRTPLTIIKGYIDVTLNRERTAEEYKSTLQNIQVEAERLIRLANDLLFLARLDAAPLRRQPEPVDLGQLLEAIIDQMQMVAQEKQISITKQITPPIYVEGMTDYLIRLFLNLLDNAVKYSGQAGKIDVAAEVIEQKAIITIRDTGSGIPEEHMPFLFERFYRAERESSQPHGGVGLGLPIAQQIIRTHHGAIQISSSPGKGTEVIITLPTIARK